MSKRITVITFFLALFIFSGAAIASSVAITNKTGFDIYEVHFASADESRWGDDVLSMNVILNDETGTVNWDSGDKNNWSIMIMDEQGHKFYWHKLDLQDVERIVLKPEGHADLQECCQVAEVE